MKRLIEGCEEQFSCLGENTEKYITFLVFLTRILIVQDLWQTQILSVVLLVEFIKLNVNMCMITKNLKRVELNTKIVNAIWNIQKEYKCLGCNKNCKKKFDENFKKEIW